MSEIRKAETSTQSPAINGAGGADLSRGVSHKSKASGKSLLPLAGAGTGVQQTLFPVDPLVPGNGDFLHETASGSTSRAALSKSRKLIDEDEVQVESGSSQDDAAEIVATEHVSVALGDAQKLAQAAAAAGTATDAAAAQGAASAATGAAAVSTGLAIGAIAAGVALISNAKSSPSAPVASVDTTAPVLKSVSASSGTNSVTLTFDKDLDSAVKPVATDFTVKIAGVAYEPKSIAISGKSVVLGFGSESADQVVTKGVLQLDISYKLAAGSSNQIRDAAGNAVKAFAADLSKEGVVADGYIRGAQIYIDVDNDGVADASEIIAGVLTDSEGRFFLPKDAPTGTIIAVGGVNTDTGLPNAAPLKAPAGSQTVNPLTTLVQEVVSKSGLTAEAAAGQVATALGLAGSLGGQSLLNFDPLKVAADSPDAGAALKVQQAAAKVATIVTIAAAEAGAASESAASKVVANLAQSIQSAGNTTLDLTDSSVLTSALSGVSVTTASRSTLVEAVSAISLTNSLTGISAQQSAFLDSKAPKAPSLSLPEAVRSSTPSVKVMLETAATDGTAVVVGDTVRIFDDKSVKIAAASVTAADLARGYIEVPILSAFALPEGSVLLKAQVVDKSGNASELSGSASMTVDVTAPTALLSNDKPSMKSGDKSTLSIVMSEAVNDFTIDDISVTVGGSSVPVAGVLGTLSAPRVTDGGVVYTVGLTAPALQGQVVVSVGKNFSDKAGNPAELGSNAVNVSVDDPPSVRISDNVAGVVNGKTGVVVYSLAFSEVVTGLTETDLVVTGGVVKNNSLVAVPDSGGRLYQVQVIPAQDSVAPIQFSLVQGAVLDSNNNPNEKADAQAQAVDTQVPVVSITHSAGSDDLLNAAEYKSVIDGTGAVLVRGESLGASGADARVLLKIGTTGNLIPVTPGSDGKWEYKLLPSDVRNLRSGEITATVVDAAGNVSESVARGITVNTAAPVVTPWSLDAASDTGVVGDGRTRLAQPAIEFEVANAALPSAPVSSTNPVSVSLTVSKLQGGVEQQQPLLSQSLSVTSASKQTFVLGNLGTEAGTFVVKITADSGGNVISRSGRIEFDPLAPTVAVSATSDRLKIGETTSVKFALSEASKIVDSVSIDPVAGTLSAPSRSGAGAYASEFTATYTPPANAEGTATIKVPNSKFVDVADNPNADASQADNTVVVAYDTKRPTVAITTANASLKGGDTPTITFGLSEESTTFTAEDITVQGGALSGFQGSGKNYTAIFTPTSASVTSASIRVSDDKFSDAFGNLNKDGADTDNLLVLSIDAIAPTISITSDKVSLKAGETAGISFVLSEVAVDFTVSDIVVSGGTLSGFQGSGKNYSAIFTPAANSSASMGLSVASGTFSDAAGNLNADGSDADNNLSLDADTIAPTIVVTSDKSALKAGESAIISFVVSEVTTDFAAADISVTGGTLTDFAAAGNGTNYSAKFTPNSDSVTAGTVSVASNKFSDRAGNQNTDGTDTNNAVSITVDTRIPTVSVTSNKASLKAGDTATINFVLSEPSTDFDAGDVAVVGGLLSGFSGSGTSYSATFTPTENSTTPGKISIASGVFKDAAGNTNVDGADANNAVEMPVDTIRPLVAVSSNKASLKAGETATITFTLSESSSNFIASDVVATGGALTGFTGSGTTYTATFTPTANSTAPGQVSVASGVFTDAAGNANADGSDANNSVQMSVDTAVPVFTSAGTASAAENQNLLYTAAATDTTTVTYVLTGADASLLNVASDGKVTLKTGNLDFDAANAKKSYAFNVEASDVAGNKATLAVAVSVTNVTSDDTGGGSTSPTAVALDSLTPAGTQTTVATFDAGTGAFAFTDDFTKTNYFQILNFGSDDTIAYPGSITEAMLSVANTGTDVQLLVNNASTVSSIILKNVCDSSAFITTVQEFNALPVGNIISVGATQFVTDTTPPTIAVSSNKTSLSVGETALITFTLSEPSSNFVISDVVATGGTLSGFIGSGVSYSATFTPTANSTTPGSVSVASGVFTDAAGNANADGSDANNSAQMAVNTVAQAVSRTAVALDELTPAGTQTQVASYNAGSGAFAFSDDFTKTNYFQILNFGSDDTIAFPGAISESMLSVANTGSDVQLLVNNASTVSSIILKNVCSPSDFITTVADFNALPVGNIVSVGSVLFA